MQVLRFAGNVYHYKRLPGNIFDLILEKKKKIATMDVSLMVINVSSKDCKH